MPDGSLFGVKAIFSLRLIHVEVKNFLLYHLWISAVERITLVKDEVYATPKGPNVNLLAEAIFF